MADIGLSLESSSNRNKNVHRNALRRSLRIEVSLLSPIAGAITALPVVAVFGIGLFSGTASGAIAMAIGANLIAIASLVGAPRLSLRIATLDALVLGLSVFVGTLSGSVTWLHLLLLVPWCFGAGMLEVFGQTSATIGSQAIIAYVVLGRFTGSAIFALHFSLFVLLGAGVEILALILLRFPPSLRFQRSKLATALDAVATLAHKDPTSAATDALAALDEAQDVLSVASLFSRGDAQELRGVFDQLRRVRLELTTLSGLRVRLVTSGATDAEAAIGEMMTPLSTSLMAFAMNLRRHRTSWSSSVLAYESLLAKYETEFESSSQADVVAAQCAAHLRALGGQLRAIGKLAESTTHESQQRMWRPTRMTSTRPSISRLRNDFTMLRDNVRWQSSSFRHAVRLAVAVPLAAIIGSSLSLPRSFWLTFAVAVILKPDYSSLLHRGLSRLVGTILGAVFAALIVGGLHPDHIVTVVLVAGAAWAAYATWSASFAVSFGFVTALVLLLLSVTTTDTLGTALDRLLDFSLGGVIALVAYLVWPTSPQGELSETFSDLFSSLGAYLDVVFDVVEGIGVSGDEVAKRSRKMRMSWSKAEAAVGRALEEPLTSRFDSSTARSELVATMRILRSLHALRIEAEGGAVVERNDELDALESACFETLITLSGAAPPWTTPPDLRHLYRHVERSLKARESPTSISLHLDELVNSLNTANELAHLETPT